MKKTLLIIVLAAAASILSSCRPARPACPAYSSICTSTAVELAK